MRERHLSEKLINSMQTPDFAPGPKFHKEVATGVRRWEQFIEQQGLYRLTNGSFRQQSAGAEPHQQGEHKQDQAETEERNRTE